MKTTEIGAGTGGVRGTVIVTGGARRIGAAIVRHLAAAGWRVVIHHRHAPHEADALVKAIGQDCAMAIDADLTAPGAANQIMAAARSAFGRPVNGVVNSASMFAYDVPPITDGESIARHMQVNLAAPVFMASAMAAQDDLKAGAVINILDQKLANLNPDFFSYSCSKAALAAATRMLAQALGPRLSVNAVAPGLILPSLDQTDAEFAAVSSINLLRRPIGVDQVARAVVFLLGSRGITGQTLFVDNGQRFLPRGRDVMFATREKTSG